MALDRAGGTDGVNSDERRMEGLFERHHLALWRFAVRMTGDAELARDLTQDTFLRALSRRLPEGDRQAEAWLMQTLVNLCRDSHRRKRVRRVHQDGAGAATAPPPPPNPESAVVARSSIDDAIGKLSVRRRSVLVLHELEGLPVEEIARALGLCMATVRWHLSRARKEVQKHLAPSGRSSGRTP